MNNANKKKGSCANCTFWSPYSGLREGLCMKLYEFTTFDECCGEYHEDPVKKTDESR